MSFQEREIELIQAANAQPSESPIEIEYKQRSFITLLKLMLVKNYLVFRRQIFLTLFLFASPLLICMLIIFWQYIVDSFTHFLVIDPPIRPIMQQIPRCTTKMDDCVSIGYFVLGSQEPWIEKVMQRVATTNRLSFGSDVKLLGEMPNPKMISEYLSTRANQTQIAVVFCTKEWSIFDDMESSLSIPCKFEQIEKTVVFYTIMYNYTLLYRSPYFSDVKISYPKDEFATSLKISLDNAILHEFAGEDKNDDENFLIVSQQEFPKIPNRFMQGIDVAGNYGAFYFFAPYLLNFLVLINELLQEKGKKLRQGATVMGLTHAAYWVSWALTAQIIVIIITVVLMLCGYLFQLDFFLKTPFFILFVLYNTFGFSIVLVAFFIATICPDVKNGYTIAYAFILTALLMQICFTQAGMAILFYRSDSSSWVKVVRFILSMYPAFKYSLIYSDISVKSCRHFSLEENRWVDGEGFTYADLYEKNAGRVQLDKFVTYESPDPLQNYFHLLLACLFYVALTYYFDRVLESNRGKADSIFFCFQCRKHRRLPPSPPPSVEPKKFDTAELERERVIKNLNTFVNGLRIVGLSKTYYKYPFSIASKDDVHALKDIYFEVDSGECLALLGHNGAGKTTLIGLLTGMFKPTRGTAQILDYDINEDMDYIRSRLGVCPQFDILWSQLTAGEHLRMFAAIKGIPKHQIEKEVEARLKEVDLLHVKDAQIQTFSGGMKRRVSLAISAIGNPKIIIMDEPTTGMDPRARRQVWKMIRAMKHNRVVLLTTHAMEEADVLADRIAVMAEGSLKAIGTSLYLKNNFSDGYRVNIVCEEVQLCLQRLRQTLGEFKVLDTSGGSIVISISFQNMNELRTLFEVLEGNKLDEQKMELKKCIKDWGLSHATLEEVFMKVTRKCE